MDLGHELLIMLGIAVLCLAIPQTKSQDEAIENRRLRAQRKNGNYNATPRTQAPKTSKMTFKTLRDEYNNN